MRNNKVLSKVLGIFVLAFTSVFLACQGEVNMTEPGLPSVESKAFSSVAGTNNLTITLSGGTFVPAEKLSVSQFVITAPDRGTPIDLTGGRVIRVTKSSVKIADFPAEMLTGSGLKVTIAGTAFDTQPKTVKVTPGGSGSYVSVDGEIFDETSDGDGTGTGTGGTVALFNSVESDAFTSAVDDDKVTITLTGGTFEEQESLHIGQFRITTLGTGGIFASLAGGQVVRISDNAVTIIALNRVKTAGSGQKFTIDGTALASQAVGAVITSFNIPNLLPLTGSVTITGNAIVGHTITGNLGLLEGSGNIYGQWKRDGEDIPRNSIVDSWPIDTPAYTVQFEDVGKAITLEVVRYNNIGRITSAPTAIVPAALNARKDKVYVNGELYAFQKPTANVYTGYYVGDTLTANANFGNGDLSYQWARDWVDIPGEDRQTYTIVLADKGKKVTVRVTRAGYTGYIVGGGDRWTIDQRPTIVGGASISGQRVERVVGERLYINPDKTLPSGDLFYQWKVGDVNIPGATKEFYDPTVADVGKTITAEVRRWGHDGFIIAGPTSPVVHGYLTGGVFIARAETLGMNDALKVGETLNANTEQLGGSGTIFYQWTRGGTTDIGTDSPIYNVVSADVGTIISVRVTRADYAGSITGTINDSSMSGSISISNPRPNHKSYDPLSMPGDPLTVNTSNLGGSGTLTYRWSRDGVIFLLGNYPTYTLAEVDIGKRIKVDAARIGEIGYKSSTLGEIQYPHIAGKVKLKHKIDREVWLEGITICGKDVYTYSVMNTEQLNGSGPMQFRWQRRSKGPFNVGDPSEAISGANGPSYTLTDNDLDNCIIFLRVTRDKTTGYLDVYRDGYKWHDGKDDPVWVDNGRRQD